MPPINAPMYDSASLFDVRGLVVVITGAGSGLGRYAAHALATNGAKAVYVLGRRREALLETKNTSSNPEAIRPIVCDVTSKESLQQAADQVKADFGYCNALFANSGVISAEAGGVVAAADATSIQEIQDKLWEPEMEEFTRSLHVNVTGAFYTAVAFLGLLDEGNRRAIVPQTSQIIITTSGWKRHLDRRGTAFCYPFNVVIVRYFL